MGIIPSSLVSDREVQLYYKDLFSKGSIQQSLTEWGEELDEEVILQSTRTVQNNPEGFSVFWQDGLLLVGSALAVVSPCFYNKTRYALEIVVSALPEAPVRTVLRLHTAFKQWAKSMNCTYMEVADGPYTPKSYSTFLSRLGYTQLGGVYVRRL